MYYLKNRLHIVHHLADLFWLCLSVSVRQFKPFQHLFRPVFEAGDSFFWTNWFNLNMSNKTGLILTLRSCFLLDFLFGGIQIANLSQGCVALPIGLESTSIFPHGVFALLFISIEFWIGVWPKIADNYGSAVTWVPDWRLLDFITVLLRTKGIK